LELSKTEVAGGVAGAGQGVVAGQKCISEVYVQGVLRCAEWGVVVVVETEGVGRQTVETDSAGTEPSSVAVTAPLSELECLRQAFVQGVLICAEWGIGPGIRAGNGQGLEEGAPVEGEAFRIGGGVSAPTVIYRVQPEYSDEARTAGYEGVVVLEAIVHSDGSVEIVRVVRSLGFGLDENAIGAIRQWKFRPGMRGGQAVAVALNIEVNFNLSN
jgi:TonB family protein